jgi:hypothetical protein
MAHVIWIYGKPGSGKTTLLHNLKEARPEMACFDADTARATLYPQLGFSDEDRQANVRILTELAAQPARYGADAGVAAVTPTKDLREYVAHRCEQIGVNLIMVHLTGRCRKLWPGTEYEKSREHDLEFDTRVTKELEASQIIVKTWLKRPPRQLFIGRWQPFHTGHQAIICEALEKGPVAIGIRQTEISEKDPACALERMACIREEFQNDDVEVFICPDINSIHIGRAVGYGIVQHAEVPGVSGTELRKHGKEDHD